MRRRRAKASRFRLNFAGPLGLSMGMSAQIARKECGAAAVERLLFVKDVAAILDVSLSTARARLVELEKRHGSAVVQRSGKRLCTRASALERVLPGGVRERPHHALEMRVARVERRAGERDRMLALLDDRLERVESQLERLLGVATAAAERV
jgi:predicted ArsR family transcriptional regulator